MSVTHCHYICDCKLQLNSSSSPPVLPLRTAFLLVERRTSHDIQAQPMLRRALIKTIPSPSPISSQIITRAPPIETLLRRNPRASLVLTPRGLLHDDNRMKPVEKVNFYDFYATFNGHEVEHLAKIHAHLREKHEILVFLAGDSSLDNKYWFRDVAIATNGYEEILDPPRMKTDVSYFMNLEAAEKKESIGVINTAVEATTLNDRRSSPRGLLPQDLFIRDNIRENDVLIVSVGGNDIALRPLARTVINMLSMIYLTPSSAIAREIAPNEDDNETEHEGIWTSTRRWWSGLSYFTELFKTQVEEYLENLLSRCPPGKRPRKVVVCMIYFPLEDARYPSWAAPSLRFLRYDSHPARLQNVIRAVFERATKRVRIEGVRSVEAFPMFEVLNGKDPGDYVARVEPSVMGSRKLARELMKRVRIDGKNSDERASTVTVT